MRVPIIEPTSLEPFDGATYTQPRTTTWFEQEKRKRNLAEGYEETKGLKDGHCNRAACQASLRGQPQSYMKDHETFTADGRLYYCVPCTVQFNEADRRFGETRRCTFVE